MKLSIYTFVKDGLYYDFHIVAMLRHHLPLADEIVVNEGFSTDGTYEAIQGIDPRVHVHRFHWDRANPESWHRQFKNQARELCTGDWCILLDCDEFIPEWEFARLRGLLDAARCPLMPVRFMHFYGNYRVVLAKARPTIPHTGLRIHRNLPDIEVWGDGANVRWRGHDSDPTVVLGETIDVHHFGLVRHPARLRQKWRTQARQHNTRDPRWDRVPGFVFDLLPHRWDDEDFMSYLGIYDGPYLQAVRADPAEFVRDDFWVYNHLKKRRVG